MKRYDFVRLARADQPESVSDALILECPDGPYIRVADLFPLVKTLFDLFEPERIEETAEFESSGKLFLREELPR